jgi:NADPH:quinone reductase-like Zn-dependent oxidoreductase
MKMVEPDGNRALQRRPHRPLSWARVGIAAWLGWHALQRLREQSLAGEVVLITGGSRGLGLLLAREYARNGCRIVICARDVEQLRAARADLESRG